jgi:hypothetical protein
MLSHAYSADQQAGLGAPSPLSSQFSEARGRSYTPEREDIFSDRQAATSQDSLDTLDLTPPSHEKLILDHIEELLKSGDVQAAAEQIRALRHEDSGFEFSPGEAQRLNDLTRETENALNNHRTFELKMPEIKPLPEIEELTVSLGIAIPLLGLF